MRLYTLVAFIITYSISQRVRNLVVHAKNELGSSGGGTQSCSSSGYHTTSDSENTKLKSIELDVKNTESKDNYKCLKKDGSAKYTPKSGYGFSSVKKSGSCCSNTVDEVWNTKEPTDYATAVVRDGTGSCSNMSKVTIFTGTNHRHFTKADSKYVLDSDIRVYGNDASNTLTELTSTQYTQNHDNDLFRFKFNDNTKCTEVKFIHRSIEKADSVKILLNKASVWKHDKSKHGDQYPKDLKYYWPDKMSINFEHAFIVHSKNEEAKWDEGHLFDFKLYVKDTNNLKELDATAYELTQDNQEFLFTFKDEVKLEEVKHKGKELWKHDSDKHGDKYPKLLKYATDKLALSFDDTFVVYTKNVDGKLGNESCFDFKLFSMESNNLKEMGVTAYDLINQDNEHVFKFKDEHKCAMVKHKVDELWKHDNSKIDGKYPKLLKYVPDKLALFFDDLFVVYTKGDDGKLKNEHLFDFKLYSKSSDNNIEEIALTTFDITDQDNAILFNFKDVKIVKVTHKGKELWKHDSNNHGDKYPLKLSYNKDGSKILINFEGFFASCIKDGDGYKVIEFFELDILSTSSTSYFQCDSQNFEITFTIKTGMICGLVKIGNKKIYEPDYPEDVVSKIVLYKNLQQENSYFDVYLLNENLKRFEKKENSDEWHRKFNPLNLDIKRKENSLYFEYTTEDNGFTYTAKHNVGFIKVITGKKKVWESKGANEYGLKVKVSGSEDTPEVKILMYNGEEKVFNVTDDQSTT